MAETEEAAQAPKKKRSKLPLVIGVAGALLAGGGGFFAVWSGLILAPADPAAEAEAAEKVGPLPDITFVPIDPIIVSLPPGARSKHLRFGAQIEVGNEHAAEVRMLMPRVMDVLNGYLRAVDAADLEDPAALIRLRAQMLRRVQIVTGEGRVRDLLITEFVLN